MQNKNTNQASAGERPNNLPAEFFSIENIPVYSMKKDLEMMANPAMTQKKSAPIPTSPAFQYASKPKNRPFLKKPEVSPAPEAPFSPQEPEIASQPEMIHLKAFSPSPVSSSFEYASTPKISPFLEEVDIAKEPAAAKKSPEKAPPKPYQQNTLKKIFIFSILTLSLAAVGVGSYYFWIIRKEEPETVAPSASIKEEPSQPATVVEPDTNVEQPKENTLVLDLTNSSLAKIKIDIETQISKLPRESFNKPAEFKIKDPQNNLVNFSLFAEKSNLNFSQKIFSYLGESFSLFFFNDGPNLGVGLVVESKNDPFLAQELLKEEPYLPKKLDVLFLPTAPEKTRSVAFSNFTYKDLRLRYFNLISPEELSIDYAATKNKLLIGTTRKTLTTLYDWLTLPSGNK